MREETVLVLCPPNMTAPRDGPNGFLGDRIHQLPALATVTQLCSQTYVWPEDPITRQVFGTLQGVAFIQARELGEVIQQAVERGVGKVICLYADPSSCPPERVQDCAMVNRCHEIAQAVAPHALSMPAELDPRGHVPMWQSLLATVRPEVKDDLQWPSLPFLVPSRDAQEWAEEYVRHVAQDKPVLVVSPMQGGEKRTVGEQWWRELARLFHHGVILVPVHESDRTKAETLFGEMEHVKVEALDIEHTAALAAVDGVHVLGVDGGTMNVLAASKPTGVLGIYGAWPASAWAMPNVMVCRPDITPSESILIVP